jgi:vitamin B12 transporter
MVLGAAGSYQYHLKKAGKKAIAGTAYMNIGTQTTARTNYRQDYNQGLSVNGNLDKFVLCFFKQHRDNRNF